MRFILFFCLCVLAFSENIESKNEELKKANRILTKTLRELAVGEDQESQVGYRNACSSNEDCTTANYICIHYTCSMPTIPIVQSESSELAIGTSPSSKHDVESDVGRQAGIGTGKMKDWPVCFPDATKKAHEYCDLRTKTGCSDCKHGHYWFWGSTYCCKPTDFYANDCRCYTSEEEIAAMESSELALGTSASKAQPADDGGCYNMCRETGASMEQCARKCPMPGETVVEHDDSTVEEEEVGKTNPWPCRDTNKVGHGRSMRPGQICNTDWNHVTYWRARHEYCKNDKGNWGCQYGYKRGSWWNDYCCDEWESRNTNRCKCR